MQEKHNHPGATQVMGADSSCPACAISSSPISEPESQGFFTFLIQRKETLIIFIATLLVLPGILFHEILYIDSMVVDGLSITAMLLAGISVFRSAWQAIWINREININVLMTIAAIGAVFIGVYTEAAMVMVLFSLSESIEEFTVEKSRDAIRSMMNLVPQKATLLTQSSDGTVQESQVELEQIQIGDVIVVKPGEQIPMDGHVISGFSNVNQAPITGESALIEKTTGSQVFASSINGEGALQIEVSSLAADNTISRMIALVEEAQEKRSPAQNFIDHFARYYTPAIVLISILVALIPPLFFGQPFFDASPEVHGWLYRGLSLLVVGCPCALVISTPVSIISAISNASRHGVMIKGGIYLEKLSQIKAFAFDKTGTLTEGRPSVIDTRTILCENEHHCKREAEESGNTHSIKDCLGCSEMIALASAVERRSEHPVAYAITNAASLQHLDTRYPTAENTTAIIGRGVTGDIPEHKITVGSHPFFKDIPHPEQHCEAARQDSINGFTPIMVESNGEYLGTITIADQLRSSSVKALEELKSMGLHHLIMLTGDVQQTAQTIAYKAGISRLYASLLPEEKLQVIEEMQKEFGAVAMVGDGINDAPALASADIGIAIGGASSTNQAMETADITLMSGDLSELPHVIRLSKKTMQMIQFNLIFIMLVKLVFILLVSSGLGTMWMAVLADTGLTTLVTLNSMRLLNYR